MQRPKGISVIPAADPSAPPPLAFTIWAGVWVVLVLLGGIALFRRREL